MSIKNSIGWTNMTCNPIKGRCQGGCPYCYYSGKRGILNRFKQNPEIRLDLSVFDKLPRIPKKIFLCSTHDLFGSWIPRKCRDIIFDEIKKRPQHIFQVLTKFPQNIDRPMPPNVWLGVTITCGERRDISLKRTKANLKFISFEPFFGIPKKMYSEIIDKRINWIIVGRLTGYGHKYDPKREWIEDIVNQARRFSIPVFLKNNLQEIWGESLIQEMPREIT